MVMLSSALSNIAVLGRNSLPFGRFVPVISSGFFFDAFNNVNQIRYFAARKGTRDRANKEKMELKLKRASQEKKTPKFMQGKNKLNIGNEASRCKDENWPEITPIDDVYLAKFYRGIPSSMKMAVELLQKLHHQTVLNQPHCFIYGTIELDLRLKKKNNFLDQYSMAGLVSFPHEFERSVSNRVIAICKNSDDQFKASEAGAVHVGTGSLIKEILSGQIIREDYDYIVCHPDSYKELSVLRGILKKKFPTAYNGLLRLDVDKAVETFTKGTSYKLSSSSSELDFGWIDVCFGRLSMSHDHLEENIKVLLNKIETHKPKGTDDFPFITRTLVWTEEANQNKIKIPHWEYIPGYKIIGEEELDESDKIDEAVQL